MFRLRVLAAACMAAMLTACADTLPSGPTPAGPSAAELAMLYGVLESSADDDAQLVLRQSNDAIVELAPDPDVGLQSLLGQTVILRGNYRTDGKFRVVQARRASDGDADFARAGRRVW